MPNPTDRVVSHGALLSDYDAPQLSFIGMRQDAVLCWRLDAGLVRPSATSKGAKDLAKDSARWKGREMRIPGENGWVRGQGFTRTELLAVVTIVLTAALVWAQRMRGGSRAVRETVCRVNLKQIGAALSVYSTDNREKLPYAAIQPRRGMASTWDRLIATPLRVVLRGGDYNAPPPPAGVALRCPEDPIEAPTVDPARVSGRRSYAMPAHRMNRPNWPPSEYNSTGVGLFWSAYRKRGNGALASMQGAAPLPAVTLDMLQDRAATIVFTEQAHPENLLGRAKFSTVSSTVGHVDETVLPRDSLHGGRINYLMADGHVEQLEPEATVGPEGKVSDAPETHFGMWTIVAGD